MPPADSFDRTKFLQEFLSFSTTVKAKAVKSLQEEFDSGLHGLLARFGFETGRPPPDTTDEDLDVESQETENAQAKEPANSSPKTAKPNTNAKPNSKPNAKKTPPKPKSSAASPTKGKKTTTKTTTPEELEEEAEDEEEDPDAPPLPPKTIKPLPLAGDPGSPPDLGGKMLSRSELEKALKLPHKPMCRFRAHVRELLEEDYGIKINKYLGKYETDTYEGMLIVCATEFKRLYTQRSQEHRKIRLSKKNARGILKFMCQDRARNLTAAEKKKQAEEAKLNGTTPPPPGKRGRPRKNPIVAAPKARKQTTTQPPPPTKAQPAAGAKRPGPQTGKAVGAAAKKRKTVKSSQFVATEDEGSEGDGEGEGDVNGDPQGRSKKRRLADVDDPYSGRDSTPPPPLISIIYDMFEQNRDPIEIPAHGSVDFRGFLQWSRRLLPEFADREQRGHVLACVLDGKWKPLFLEAHFERFKKFFFNNPEESIVVRVLDPSISVLRSDEPDGLKQREGTTVAKISTGKNGIPSASVPSAATASSVTNIAEKQQRGIGAVQTSPRAKDTTTLPVGPAPTVERCVPEKVQAITDVSQSRPVHLQVGPLAAPSKLPARAISPVTQQVSTAKATPAIDSPASEPKQPTQSARAAPAKQLESEYRDGEQPGYIPKTNSIVSHTKETPRAPTDSSSVPKTTTPPKSALSPTKPPDKVPVSAASVLSSRLQSGREAQDGRSVLPLPAFPSRPSPLKAGKAGLNSLQATDSSKDLPTPPLQKQPTVPTLARDEVPIPPGKAANTTSPSVNAIGTPSKHQTSTTAPSDQAPSARQSAPKSGQPAPAPEPTIQPKQTVPKPKAIPAPAAVAEAPSPTKVVHFGEANDEEPSTAVSRVLGVTPRPASTVARNRPLTRNPSTAGKQKPKPLVSPDSENEADFPVKVVIPAPAPATKARTQKVQRRDLEGQPGHSLPLTPYPGEYQHNIGLPGVNSKPLDFYVEPPRQQYNYNTPFRLFNNGAAGTSQPWVMPPGGVMNIKQGRRSRITGQKPTHGMGLRQRTSTRSLNIHQLTKESRLGGAATTAAAAPKQRTKTSASKTQAANSQKAAIAEAELAEMEGLTQI